MGRGVLDAPPQCAIAHKAGHDGECRGAMSANKNAAGCPAAFEIQQPEYEKPLLPVVLFLAADGLELGEHGADVEIVALLFGRLEFRFLLRGRAPRRA
jgi:hypothetical protein